MRVYCGICGGVFVGEASIARKKRNEHINECMNIILDGELMRYYCNECGFYYHSDKSRDEHYSDHHCDRGVLGDDGRKPWDGGEILFDQYKLYDCKVSAKFEPEPFTFTE